MSARASTYLRSAPTGLNERKTVSQACVGGGEIRTCDFGVWTEIKRTVVVFGRAGTVGSNVLLDLTCEIEVVYHVL